MSRFLTSCCFSSGVYLRIDWGTFMSFLVVLDVLGALKIVVLDVLDRGDAFLKKRGCWSHDRLVFFMHALHRHAIIAGRRVVQARSLCASLPFSAELVPDVAQSSSAPKKKSKSTPFPNAKAKKPSLVTRKKARSGQVITGDQKPVHKHKGGPAAREHNAPRRHSQTGLIPDNWGADWGKDGTSAPLVDRPNATFRGVALAPPPSSPTKRRAPKLRPRKEIVPNPSSSTRALPPHRIPYVRRTEGYISDEAEQCNSVLRGASRDVLILQV